MMCVSQSFLRELFSSHESRRYYSPRRAEEETNVYECKVCRVAFVTEDQVPVFGERALQ